MELQGKIAVVTGAGNGIGKATAKLLSANGAAVIIADINLPAAEQVSEEIRASGGQSFAIHADVSQQEHVNKMFDFVTEQFGRLDILVNNVGDTIRKPTIEFTEEEWDRLFAINLKSTFMCSQRAGKLMLKQKSGAVVNISSIHGLGGISKRNPYATAKTAVNSFTRTLACEWAMDGVRVNSIAPGYILTSSLASAIDAGLLNQDDLIRRTPQGRMGSPEDIAEAVLFLVSDRASFITGITLYVDGGYSAYHGPEAVPSFHHHLT